MINYIKRMGPSLVAVAIAFAAAFILASVINDALPEAVIGSDLYANAVADAVKADADEIMPLVTIGEADVLLITFHSSPEIYPDGADVKNDWGEVWTVTADEIKEWYSHNNGGVTDWNLRMKQLMGLPADGEFTHFTAMMVSPKDIVRPAYSTDIFTDEMRTDLPEDTEIIYREWFERNIIDSYFTSNRPWTRLGYTYDWGDVNTEYGLTEFVIVPNSTVIVEFTKTTDEFVEWLKK